jgi:hydroxysqualene dehydroxylase
MKRGVVHVVGAGASGLAAAHALLASGRCDVVVHEAKPYAGGRRRSFHDDAFGLDVDTGNFPVLSGWRSTLGLIEAANARGEWREEADPGVDFADFSSGKRWRLRPNSGRLPWWLLDAGRRGPNVNLADYWPALRLASAPADATIAELAPKTGMGFDSLWRPLSLAALNCPAETASARLAGAALRAIAASGGRGMRLLVPVSGFGRAFVEPLSRTLERAGAKFRFGRRLGSIDAGPDRVSGLDFESDRLDLAPGDAVVMATSWHSAALLVPGLEPPAGAAATLTVHFSVIPPPRTPAVIGALNGPFHWLFAYRDRISVTILNAAERIEAPRDALAADTWRGVAALTGLSDALPAWRVVPARRAGALSTLAEASRRPPGRTRWRNLFLAGGYVQGPLPDGLERAVRSGEEAAQAWIEADV